MAINWGQLGGTALGAGAGFMFGGPVGAATGAGIGGSLMGGLFGGGDDDVMSPGEMYNSLFGAWRKSLPKYLKSVQKYEPQFLGQQVKMQEDYAPNFATATRNANIAGNPEAFAALTQLSNALNSRGDLTSLNMSPELTDQLQQDLRASQFARGVTLSPASALQEARATLTQRIAERDKWLTLAQVLSGNMPSYSAGAMTGNRFGDMAPPQISNMSSLQQQANQIAFDRYNSNQKMFGAGLQGLGSIFSSMGGSSSGLAGANSMSGGGMTMEAALPILMATL
jgi:hypothetical protein